MRSHPKPQSVAAERAAKRRLRVAAIIRTREAVFARDKDCRFPEALRSQWPCGGPHEMDERVPRSRLRGRPPDEIFNLDNCMRLCRDHHRMKTEHKLCLEGDSANGSIDFVLGGDRP